MTARTVFDMPGNRSLKHLLQVIDNLGSWGVDFVAMRDAGIDTTTAAGRLMLQLIGAFAEFERTLIVERVVAGVRKAQANGVHCGRPPVDVDIAPAIEMVEAGHGLKRISTALGVSRSTLRRRLIQQGAWPRRGCPQG